MDKRQKMINALVAFSNEREATCPKCGSHKFKIGYIETNKKEQIGFGAFWCEDCRQAVGLCRANLKKAETRNKIVDALPNNLKYI